MLVSGTVAYRSTLNAVLSACLELELPLLGVQLRSWVIQSGLALDVCVGCSLADTYVKFVAGGSLHDSRKVFDQMQDNSVIMRSIKLFSEMIKGLVRPNHFAFASALKACGTCILGSGHMEDAQRAFDALFEKNLISHGTFVDAYAKKSMYTKHGILPGIGHYACMVDLLGRSESLVDALQFINSMLLKADALVWPTFLGACRVHGNVELAKPAVVMTGYRWIQMKNIFHKFYLGDTSHPKARYVYDELDRLASRKKKLGYVLNTEFEQHLLHHPVKIAVVLGLISTSSPKSIRVFKNLHICRDCHSVIKYSMETRRSIVVRDANQFHHFMEGTCSSNDYW
ncbi:hypothetical protein EUGRSUZ_K00446 [Eucalyptus grandis]|uniref:Uncharacterized protein n=2 Tax=Eucalyptus grandis TaxID=71139 RepID=A0ACC3IQI8_EUCGR|nr:hypothetical protein EUGRSUZ_K00446 [Eucalyptus grandis]